MMLFFFFLTLPARHPNAGPASAEGDPQQAALEVQELCRAHHHEGAGGSEGPAQGGDPSNTHTRALMSVEDEQKQTMSLNPHGI